MSAPVVEPSACTWCGIARRGHAQQFADAVGWHKWAAPTDAQIKARMKARRLVLTVAREGALPMPVGPEPQEPRPIAYAAKNTDLLLADAAERSRAAEWPWDMWCRICHIRPTSHRTEAEALEAADRHVKLSHAPQAEVHRLMTAGGLAELEGLRARVAELEQAAEQIRSLHTDSPMGPCPVCVDADAMGRGEDYTVPYPCPTARLAGAKDCDPPSVERSADRLTRFFAPAQALREDGDRARCLTPHAFSPRDGWRTVCTECDHGKDAGCHQSGGGR